jgi:predicted DNA-binding transcriptional regulator AlpA
MRLMSLLYRRFVMRLLSKKQVTDRVGISTAEVYRRVKDSRFPQPVKNGHHHNSRVFWLESEIDDYIDSLIAERDKAHSS